MKRTTKNNRKNKPRTEPLKTVSITHPPQLNDSNIVHSTRLRFRVLSTVESQTVTYKNLCDTILVATTTTALSCIFSYVKVRAVEMWFYPRAANGLDDTVAVSFLSFDTGADGSGRIHSDTSMALEPAHVFARPVKDSLCAKWQNQTDTGTAFVLRAPAGTIIDVELSFKNRFAAGVAATNVGAALSAGAQYLRGLDGLAGASTNFIPQLSTASLIA